MKSCLAFIAGMFLFCNLVLGQSYDLLTRADSGDVYAQTMLGDMFAAGESVTQDYAEAVRWYRLAARRGVPKAQLSLGLLYSQGQGVAQNIEIAYQWAFVAAAQGVNEAIETRDLIGGQLDAEELGRAEQLALRCVESKYAECEW
ncbi:MAG: tetratricopeptide repeat protein [Gammaproteobacteria bacterium]